MMFTILGVLLIIFGLLVSIVFWLPSIFNRSRVKELMGRHYPLIYVIYIANGPMLILFGILLFIWPRVFG